MHSGRFYLRFSGTLEVSLAPRGRGAGGREQNPSLKQIGDALELRGACGPPPRLAGRHSTGSTSGWQAARLEPPRRAVVRRGMCCMRYIPFWNGSLSIE